MGIEFGTRGKAAKVQFKSVPLVGIDIGSDTVKVATGQYKGGKVVVDGLYSRKLPPKCVLDGKVQRTDKTASVIQGVMVENRIVNKNCVCTLESSECVRRDIHIPAVKPAQIMDAIRYQIGEVLPIDVSAYAFQYKVLARNAGAEGGQMFLSVCGMPTSIASQYQHMITQAGRKAYALDTNTNGLEKLLLLNSRATGVGGNIIFLDIGHTQCTVSFHSDNHCFFSKKLDIGGEQLTTIFQNNLSVTVDEAEKVKLQNLSRISMIQLLEYYSEEATQISEADNTQEKIVKQVMRQVNHWVEEIDRATKLFSASNGSNHVDQIYMYGGSSAICDLDKLLARRLKLPVSRVDSLASIQLSKRVNLSEDVSSYINAIGALVRT